MNVPPQTDLASRNCDRIYPPLPLRQGAPFMYLDADCSGTPYSWSSGFTESLLDLDGRFYTQSTKLTAGTLMRGLRRPGQYRGDTGAYTPTSECTEVEQVVPTYSLSEFTPAQEVLNAVYTVRLEQPL